jgi:hypothetical protein
MLTNTDLKQIEKLGISRETIDWQLSVFKKGPIYIQLDREAKPGDGILRMDDNETAKLIRLYDMHGSKSKIKFVPASGAATRMFKTLFDYLESAKKGKKELNSFLDTFFKQISHFAFFEELNSALKKKKLDMDKLLLGKHHDEIVKTILFKDGLNYGSLPKGLLKFHKYKEKPRTPFEEHLVEAALYALSPGKLAKLHFTVSPEHLPDFKKLLEESVDGLKQKFDVQFDVSFSVQQPSTDTMAVDMQDDPIRNVDGSILFRPGGHGALIDNLNALDADLVFIKNIDNVVPESNIQPTVRYKKVLAGKLIEIQEKVFGILKEIDSSVPAPARLHEMFTFVNKELCYELSQKDKEENVGLLRKILNRPIRVCGVVKNQGEPGGGPFWAPNTTGDTTLQIIESSQVNHDNAVQAEKFLKATHFNPVDLVCSPKTYKGEKFNLTDYIDKNTCFISYKSKDGKELKALELPGLWNGAMADWLTLFVEVPMETFNPVKTVNDLLRPQHQQL